MSSWSIYWIVYSNICDNCQDHMDISAFLGLAVVEIGRRLISWGLDKVSNAIQDWITFYNSYLDKDEAAIRTETKIWRESTESPLKKAGEVFSILSLRQKSPSSSPKVILPNSSNNKEPGLRSVPIKITSESSQLPSEKGSYRLAAIRAKLAEETAQKRREQGEYYGRIREEMTRKHKKEMLERESTFMIIIKDKMKAEKEEFLHWATIPD